MHGCLCVHVYDRPVHMSMASQKHTTPLMEACAAGQLKIVKYLCQRGAGLDINRVWSVAFASPLGVGV